MSEMLGPISSAMKRKLEEKLSPIAFKLVNDSHKHSSHFSDESTDAGKAKETHFRLNIVSEAFAGMPLLKRHQMVYSIVDDEIKGGVHALSMQLKTPKEVEKA
eukprot:gene23119-30320_t